jgi:predicted GNAT superfamily acetyltransferase
MTEHAPRALETLEAVSIRRADTIADYRACQEAQRRAWGIGDEGYLIPIATMIGANRHGGLVLGGFLPDGTAAAMSFAFLGRIRDRVCLYSQLTGVVPEYQSHGLGYQLKMHQRELARGEGIERIAWAFDPLQSGNAHFNLTRLGATSGSFIENMYGERTDALNAGVPTDRLIVEWETSAAASKPGGIDIAALPNLIDTDLNVSVDLQTPRLALEIPMDIARLRREAAALAERWRAAVAQAFQVAFAAGYRAVSFARDESGAERRGFYVLERL